MNIKDIWDPEDNHQSSSNFSARKRKTGNARAIIEDMEAKDTEKLMKGGKKPIRIIFKKDHTWKYHFKNTWKM